ncbi:MAG TPA: thymidine phosphorylase [Candidatus Ornithocaccomicrobium faecavium]|uniref:Pyrimidine-nucleoside phosphorylase n=1 Tax=Candidatus Ornithocaccomicrobium faecavium TaxID=2840890 RepID=A0A9D1P782_9FIRM|nr:thymidine phosphorylase [Candidatus Ornithocaccomicrobium faecavium]
MPTPVEIIRKKRLGAELSNAEIAAFVRGVVDGTFADYQISALLMAICIQGMTKAETRCLTMEMAHSGDILDLSCLSGPTVDKHSTGGVGDTTSLILVPLVAACGAKVAKMSGRGLGFTGGTLDKLESIPGLCTAMEETRFLRTVEEIGCAIISQTGDLAPADKVLYALRDVTATVDSMPLIVSSILSKKIASGAQNIVLDVKCGSGALMETLEDAKTLAQMLVEIGNAAGRRFCALVTDMNQPLGMNVGNALEVREAIEILSGQAGGALKEISLEIGAKMLALAGIPEGRTKLTAALESGAGLKKLAQMIAALGGDPRVTEDVSLLPQAEAVLPVCAAQSGYIQSVTASEIGRASLLLGAGRIRKEDPIDPAVGIVMAKRIGEWIDAGEPLAHLHVSSHSNTQTAAEFVRGAVVLSQEPVIAPPLIYASI